MTEDKHEAEAAKGVDEDAETLNDENADPHRADQDEDKDVEAPEG